MDPLRRAHEETRVPVGLVARIRAAIAGKPLPKRSRWSRIPGWAAVAALLVLAVAGGLLNQYVRFPGPAGDPGPATIFAGLAESFRPGLSDHIQCLASQNSRKRASSGKFFADLTPRYRGLIEAFRRQAPRGYEMAIAHECHFDGRTFTHLALRDDRSRLVSLVIARKKEGESFQAQRLPVALTREGLSFFEARAQPFAISAFEARAHLVYTISELPAGQNMEILVAMARHVNEILVSLEQ